MPSKIYRFVDFLGRASREFEGFLAIHRAEFFVPDGATQSGHFCDVGLSFSSLLMLLILKNLVNFENMRVASVSLHLILH
jgi:hypothetical protein